MLLHADWKPDSDRQNDDRRDTRPEGSTESRKSGGVVYTPTVLSDYVARKVTQLYFNDHQTLASVESLRVLDPACGKGELLESVWQSVAKLDHSNHYLDNTFLFGIDIDERALQYTCERMRRLSPLTNSRTPRFQALRTNSLLPLNGATSLEGWAKVKSQFDAPSGFDIIIANPPWGADTSKYRHQAMLY